MHKSYSFKANFFTCIITVALVFLIQTAIKGTSVRAAEISTELNARSFNLVDGAGNVRGQWTASDDGASFSVQAPDGKSRIVLGAANDASLGVYLFDSKNQMRGGMELETDGDVSLFVKDSKEKPRGYMAWAEEQKTASVGLTDGASSQALLMIDPKGIGHAFVNRQELGQ